MPAVVIQLITGFDEVSVAELEALVPRLSEPGRRFVMSRPSGELRAMRVAQLLCLASQMDQSPDSISIETEPSGRPLACDSALHMSVSHSASTLAVAFGDAPVGVDIEYLRRRDEGVMRRLFSADEIGVAVDDENFTRLWVCKEAYAKWTGVGLGEYLADGLYQTRVRSSRHGTVFLGVASDENHEVLESTVAHLLRLSVA